MTVRLTTRNHSSNTKKVILAAQGDWKGKDVQADWLDICGTYCNVETNERGLRNPEFATYY